MKAAFIISSLLALLFLPPKGSEVQFKQLKKIKKNASSMTTDPLGNLYLTNKNFIWRYNNNGDSIGAFNSRKYGDISFMDATDPYQILVFFQDYNQIVFLDNYLSENGSPVDLQALGYDQVTMVCQSREKGIWIYDQLKQKAYRLDNELNVTHETVNLSQWFGKRIMPSAMIEYNNKLYLTEKESGIYVFDIFATFLKKIPITQVDHIQLFENNIHFLDSNQFCQYNFKSFNKQCQNLSNNNLIDARVEKNRLYLLDQKAAYIFKTN